MTNTNAQVTQGSMLSAAISGTQTTLTKRTKIKPHPRKRAKLETTDLDSADETSLPGIRRGGELELECNWNPKDSTHDYLETSYQAGNIESWVFTTSAGSTYAFSGWISELDLGEATTDGVLKGSIKIQVTGVTTLTA